MPITWSCPLFHFGLSIFSFSAKCFFFPLQNHARSCKRSPSQCNPNATPVTDGESHTQITPQEALLSSQFMETLVNRVADEVFRRLAPAPTPPAPTPPVPTSDLQEVPAGPLANHTAPTPVDALARNIVQGNLQKEAAAITGLPQQSSHTTAPHIPKNYRRTGRWIRDILYFSRPT